MTSTGIAAAMHRLLPLMVVAFWAAVAHAQVYVAPMSLVGRWSSSMGHPQGVTVVVFTQNMKFGGFSTTDGRSFVDFGGTWAVSGHTLTWHYETSSGPAPAVDTTQADEIVSVDASKLVLRSKSTGMQFEFTRER